LVTTTTIPPLLELVTSSSTYADRKDLDRLLLESLDDVLADLLGKSVREAFYDHMERNYYFARDDVPKRLGDFLLLLERTFGKSGRTIERAVAKRLYTKLGWAEPRPPFDT